MTDGDEFEPDQCEESEESDHIDTEGTLHVYFRHLRPDYLKIECCMNMKYCKY